MHIIIVNQWYPPESGYGGVAMHNYYSAHAYAALGHEVTVISSRLSPTVPTYRRDRQVHLYRVLQPWDSYRIRQLPVVGRYLRPIRQLLYSAKVCHMMIRLSNSSLPDVVEFADVNGEGFFWRDSRDMIMAVRCHTPTFV